MLEYGSSAVLCSSSVLALVYSLAREFRGTGMYDSVQHLDRKAYLADCRKIKGTKTHLFQIAMCGSIFPFFWPFRTAQCSVMRARPDVSQRSIQMASPC